MLKFVTKRLPDLQRIAQEVRAQGLAIEPSELHGALCGWLAGGGCNDAAWIARVLATPDLPDERPGSDLARLRALTAAQFSDGGLELDLLLADDDASLEARSGSLFAWCRGFLGGFGLATGAESLLNEEGREALNDLARFAAAEPQADGDLEDEQALIEIHEFVRMTALLFYGDCVLAVRHRRRLH